MRDDGDIDYSKYTLRELEEALAGINSERYPKNYQKLRAAHERLTTRHADAPEPVTSTAPATPEAASDAAGRSDVWESLRNSRSIRAATGAVCLWWAYDILRSDTCPEGRKLVGATIGKVCERFGHDAAASVPFLLGLLLLFFAAWPNRSEG